MPLVARNNWDEYREVYEKMKSKSKYILLIKSHQNLLQGNWSVYTHPITIHKSLAFVKYVSLIDDLFSYHNPVGVKLLIRLKLGFSHSHEDKFRHNFYDAMNPLCSCSLEPETISFYLLCCLMFSSSCSALINNLNLIDPSISQLNETALANILLYGDFKKSTSQNSKNVAEYYQINICNKTIWWITLIKITPTCDHIIIYIYFYNIYIFLH